MYSLIQTIQSLFSARRETVPELCERVKGQWPKTLPEEGWYLAVISTLITCAQFEACKEVFHYLVETSHTTDDAKKKLTDRMKDLTMKQWTIVGIPLSIIALATLAKAEAEAGIPTPPLEEQRKNSYYETLSVDDSVRDRGYDGMLTVYRHNLPPIMAAWGQHQADFEWLEKRYIYGLFLSDYTFLNNIETEIIILSSIMAQSLPGPTMWHIRGMRRLGVDLENTEHVCNVIKEVAGWSGRDGSQWLKAQDVKDI